MSQAVRGLVINLLLVFAATAFILVVLEIGLRLLGTRMLFPVMFVEDAQTVYRLKPNVKEHVIHEGFLDYRYSVNPQGFRGTRATQVPKPSGVKRIVTVGDSFTFGVGVPDHQTYPARLEERIRSWCDSSYEVVNAGVGGFGTSHELSFLEHYGWALDPDVIVVGFVTSDPEDNSLRGLHRLAGDRLENIPLSERPGWGLIRAHEHVPFYSFLSRHSTLFNWIRYQVGHLAARRAEAKERNQGRAGESHRLASAPLEETRWRLTEALFQRLSADVQRHNTRLFVAIIPHGGTLAEVYAEGRAETLDRFHEICARVGLQCIDVAAWIAEPRPEAEPASLYLPEGHFTAEGYDLVSEAVAAGMAEDLECASRVQSATLKRALQRVVDAR